MPVSQSSTTTRFGLFELDIRGRELYRGGIRIKLAPQPFDLLTALIEQPGTVIPREALQQRLWPPNTYVDYEQGLNKTVRKLREALGDSAESPRYIETVQRAGYRFIAPVVRPDRPSLDLEPLPQAPGLITQPATQQKSTDASGPKSRGWKPVALLAAFMAFTLAVAAIGHRWRQATPRIAQSSASNAVDPRAQDAYLHGRYLWFGEHALASSDYFKRAIELQPDYAPAWAGMSMYYGAALIRGRLDPAGGIALQEEAALKSVALAPSLPEAHLAMCGSIFLTTWQFQAANTECNRALQLDPNYAEVYHFQSKMLAALNRQQEAVETQRKGSRLDPLSRPWALGQALIQARRYDEALSEIRVRMEAFPHDPTLLRLMADVSRERGNQVQAAEYLERAYRYSGDEPSATHVRDTFRNGGFKAVVRWELARMLEQNDNSYVSPFKLAVLYAKLGDREHTIAMLNKALDQHAPELLWIRCYPEFDGFASDSRYQQVIDKLPSA